VDSTTVAAPTSTTVPATTSSSGSELGQSILGEWELLAAESAELDPEDEAGLITVTFTSDRISGVESCAPFSGTYRIEGDVLVFERVETTAEGCGDWTDEADLIRFARENPTVSMVGDRLVLNYTDWRLEFGRVT
jgi:heat shock protein HslJ